MAKTAFGRPLPVPLHGNARLRRWLGATFAGDPAQGDLVWRRIVHLSGALVLLYFVIPGNFYVTPWPATTTVIILLLLEAGLWIELLRHLGYVEVPMIRPYERDRIAGFCWYAMGLATAVLLFPEAIAVTVILGAAFIDPIIGELRRRNAMTWYPTLPFVLYFALASTTLATLGHWEVFAAIGFGALAAAVALAVERLRLPLLDDDFLMPVVPGLFLVAVLALLPGVLS